ncbi:hypothetical protein BGY98DRAFT_974482 [Russula aff. rugulosa BPL654]|nr:hypothetical protein BGY98DRAFT_974482 [Russula aff. rugulosa BPL654]
MCVQPHLQCPRAPPMSHLILRHDNAFKISASSSHMPHFLYPFLNMTSQICHFENLLLTLLAGFPCMLPHSAYI